MQKHKTWLIDRKKRTILLCAFLVLSHYSFSQQENSTKPIKDFGGAVTVTNNGISLLPTFSLGKPAIIFDMVAGNKKLSFEPQFRFSLEGKPWSFVFWWRYKLLKTDRFSFNVGAHSGIVFSTMYIQTNGISSDVTISQRYLAGELSPNYWLTKNISIGMYYLHTNGLEEGATRSTNFVTFNTNFSNIKLSEQFYIKFKPQFYYLKMDERDGYYVTATLTFAKKSFPLFLQSILNQAIETNIPTKNDFVWNVSLIYSFNNEYVKK